MKDCNEMTYDADSDSLWLGLKCEWVTNEDGHKTYGNGPVLVDVVEGEVVAIEVLNASKTVFRRLIPTMSGGTLRSYRQGHSAPTQEEGAE